jgi:hypothetical protein
LPALRLPKRWLISSAAHSAFLVTNPSRCCAELTACIFASSAAMQNPSTASTGADVGSARSVIAQREHKHMVNAYKPRRRLNPRKRCNVVTVTSVADALGERCARFASNNVLTVAWGRAQRIVNNARSAVTCSVHRACRSTARPIPSQPAQNVRHKSGRLRKC